MQAAVAKVVPARRSDMPARMFWQCYGSDITRKKKLLEKAEEGKKRWRQSSSWREPCPGRKAFTTKC